LHNNVCSIASVGDSRAYLITPDGIQQITNDHTVVEYLHSKGIISEDEMKVHSMKNVITRAVGVDKGVEADYFEIDVQKGSLILLCTDGLTNVLSDEAIYSMVYGRNVEISVADIVETANAQGSKDNITAVIISV
ncbi:MAG: serine/threonine-protein phosphatase, partial [Oscillospiraceae bacterium]|nr:serine/threonine-protein phosphatase [Oscillospiraceae bacterium]